MSKIDWKIVAGQYKDLAHSLIDTLTVKPSMHLLGTHTLHKKDVDLIVSKDVIDFLDLHNVENNEGVKYFIIGGIKYQYKGELKPQRTGELKKNE